MTILLRLATAAVLFVFLFVVAYFLIIICGSMISGAVAGASHPHSQDSYELGRQAGQNFVKNNITLIVLGAFGVSAVSSLALSFSGVFPWCRKTS